MNSIDTIINATDPVTNLYNKEAEHIFYSFCAFVCILHNKKLNLANIFLIVLKTPPIREVYKTLCDHDNDYDALKMFFRYDQTLHKSKYIKKYLNQHPRAALTT